jgi:hypothetical protein
LTHIHQGDDSEGGEVACTNDGRSLPCAVCHIAFGNRLAVIAGNSGSTLAAAKSPMPPGKVLSGTPRQARRKGVGN